MTHYNDNTRRIAAAITPLLKYAADLIDVFVDDDNAVFVVLRTDTDDDPEIMLRVE